jgi:hypothetical protein
MRAADSRHDRSVDDVPWVGLVAFALIVLALLVAIFGGGRRERPDPNYSQPFLGNEV